MFFGMRKKIMEMKKARAKEEAKLYGVQDKKFDDYWDKRQKEVYAKKMEAERKAEIKAVTTKGSSGSGIKGAMKHYSKYRKSRKLKGPSLGLQNTGSSTAGPSFGGVDRSVYDLGKKKEGGPKFGL